MSVQKAYGSWSRIYDNNENKTRDLEAIALRDVLSTLTFSNCLEIGCGTGKNTAWLCERATAIKAIDFSPEMLSIAREKIKASSVEFIEADITQPWFFADSSFDLATCSLVLEHIRDLEPIFKNLSDCLVSNGYVYIGELHPFRQYQGSQARFIENGEEQLVTAFIHHISEYAMLARQYGFRIEKLLEYFDDDNRESLPRLLVMLLVKE